MNDLSAGLRPNPGGDAPRGPRGSTHPSLVEVTTRQLREEILTGQLAPGQRLIEDQIRLRFAISRAPLREALRCWLSRDWWSTFPGAACG